MNDKKLKNQDKNLKNSSIWELYERASIVHTFLRTNKERKNFRFFLFKSDTDIHSRWKYGT